MRKFHVHLYDRMRARFAGRPKAYSHLQVEAALCIWEDLLERQGRPLDHRDRSLIDYWELHGTVEMRHLSIALADYCLAVYDAIPEETRYARPYDWEIIPAILDTIEWTNPHVRRPPRDAAIIVTQALNDADARASSHQPHQPKEDQR